jgi:hypothetical protein
MSPVASTRVASICCAAVAVVLTLAAPLSAQSTFSNGTTQAATAVRQEAVTSGDMAGLAVSWGYLDGTVRTGTFELFPYGSWGVRDGRFAMDFEGTPGVTTDQGRWRVFLAGPASTVSPLTWIRLSGRSIGLAFDCGWVTGRGCASTGAGLDAGSPGSGLGYSFEVVDADTDATATAEFTNVWGLGGASPVGDLFEEVTIRFSNPGDGGLLGGDNLSFRLDTDLLDGAPTSVPEPATVALLVIGAVFVVRRHRAVR